MYIPDDIRGSGRTNKGGAVQKLDARASFFHRKRLDSSRDIQRPCCPEGILTLNGERSCHVHGYF